MICLDEKRAEVRVSAAKKTVHNCDTKPVLAAKTDFIGDSLLLIQWNLLKKQEGPKIPAYRLARHKYMKDEYLDFSASEMPQNCDSS